MFDVAAYTTEQDVVDWHELADRVFPADALRTAQAVIPLTVLRSGV